MDGEYNGESIPAAPPVGPVPNPDEGVTFSWFPFIILLIGILAVVFMKGNCRMGAETVKKWRRNTVGRMSSRESELKAS